jgi:hypothetical protein
MKSLTIHGIDDPVIKLIKAKAENDGESMNKTIKKLLEQSLGITSGATQPHRKDFEALCGIWKKGDKKSFDSAVSDFEKIDESEWK